MGFLSTSDSLYQYRDSGFVRDENGTERQNFKILGIEHLKKITIQHIMKFMDLKLPSFYFSPHPLETFYLSFWHANSWFCIVFPPLVHDCFVVSSLPYFCDLFAIFSLCYFGNCLSAFCYANLWHCYNIFDLLICDLLNVFFFVCLNY